MSATFTMFLIDRGVMDACTLGQWHQYTLNSNRIEFNEIVKICKKVDPNFVVDDTSPTVLALLLAYLYPDQWILWQSYCRLTGRNLAGTLV